MYRSSKVALGEAVRLVEGGPVMTVEGHVNHLLLCVWLDEVGRVRRETFSPQQLEACLPEHTTWLKALVRLSSKWKVVVATK
jgi:uncharacterized protein YodC (DUF2158 family)